VWGGEVRRGRWVGVVVLVGVKIAGRRIRYYKVARKVEVRYGLIGGSEGVG
jgi:hypothetical protein